VVYIIILPLKKGGYIKKMLKDTYMFNNYPIGHVLVDGVVYFDPKKLFYIASDFQREMRNVTKEFRIVSRNNIYQKRKKGRYSNLMINSEGIVEYLRRKPCYSDNEIEAILFWLKDHELIEHISINLSRKEIAFGNELISFFNFYNINVDKQVEHESFIIDFVINGALAIEYDEDKHRSYNKELELKREQSIERKYKLIRVNDSKSIGHNLGFILKEGGWL